MENTVAVDRKTVQYNYTVSMSDGEEIVEGDSLDFEFPAEEWDYLLVKDFITHGLMSLLTTNVHVVDIMDIEFECSDQDIVPEGEEFDSLRGIRSEQSRRNAQLVRKFQEERFC